MNETGFNPQGQLCTPQQMAAAQGQLCTPQQAMTQGSITIPVAELVGLIPYVQSLLSGMMPMMPGMMPMMPQQPGNGPDIYQIDKPVEKPNVLQVNEPHVGKPTKSPEEALKVVFSLLFPNGYTVDENLFEKGMDSFMIMQIVTRCAENGYRVKMQDIFRNPTFNGIVSKMEAGE